MSTVSAADAAAELEVVTQRAINEAARCGHRPGLCPFCEAHLQAVLDAAEAYAATVAARMLDNFREGLPARKRTTLAERITTGPQTVRLGAPARKP